MTERMPVDAESLVELAKGEQLLITPNFRIAADYEPGFQNEASAKNLFLEPRTRAGVGMLFQVAKFHDIYDFTHRPVRDDSFGASSQIISQLPCLVLDDDGNTVEHLVRNPGDSGPNASIPSLHAMESGISNRGSYEIVDRQGNALTQNHMTRHIKLLQAAFKDTIPDKIIHSNDPDSYYKVRKNWWAGLLQSLEVGLLSGEFNDPEAVDLVKGFFEKYWTPEFTSPHHLTTPNDIDQANGLISVIWERYGTS